MRSIVGSVCVRPRFVAKHGSHNLLSPKRIIAHKTPGSGLQFLDTIDLLCLSGNTADLFADDVDWLLFSYGGPRPCYCIIVLWVSERNGKYNHHCFALGSAVTAFGGKARTLSIWTSLHDSSILLTRINAAIRGGQPVKGRLSYKTLLYGCHSKYSVINSISRHGTSC